MIKFKGQRVGHYMPFVLSKTVEWCLIKSIISTNGKCQVYLDFTQEKSIECSRGTINI